MAMKNSMGISYRIVFGTYEKSSIEEAKNLIEDYLVSLWFAGQIDLNRYSTAIFENEHVAYVYALGNDAGKRNSHSRSGLEHIRELKKFFTRTPVWVPLEERFSKTKIAWQKAPFLFLFTNFMTVESPIRRGDTAKPIPVYRFSLDDIERENIVLWAHRYRNLQGVWADSHDLEMQAYRAIADPESKLSQSGLESCRIIEKSCGVPTYYYLDRSYGRKEEDERNRKCPLCDGEWYIGTPETEQCTDEFLPFDFRCDKCRLLSHLLQRFPMTSFEDLRYAKIGEPKRKSILNENIS